MFLTCTFMSFIGAVVEAKPQLVGSHERVRSDVEGNMPKLSSGGASQGVKRPASASNPSAEEASELLRYETE